MAGLTGWLIWPARAAVLGSLLKSHALFQAQPAVFLDKNTKVICQGMTGKNGTFHTEQVTIATFLVEDHVRRRRMSHNHLERLSVSHAVIHAEPWRLTEHQVKQPSWAHLLSTPMLRHFPHCHISAYIVSHCHANHPHPLKETRLILLLLGCRRHTQRSQLPPVHAHT